MVIYGRVPTAELLDTKAARTSLCDNIDETRAVKRKELGLLEESEP